jgi:general secretion pathway protein A
MVLTGDAGTGKTSVLAAVLESFVQSEVLTSFIVNPTLTASEFLEMVLLDFGMEAVPDSKARRLNCLHNILFETAGEGKVAVLVVDEAQQMDPALLEEVRLMGNLEGPFGKFLQIVLVGQNELNAILDRSDLRQLKQRIAVRVRLEPLTAAQVPEYIDYRWNAAGGEGNAPFAPEALKLITLISAGIPRVVNGICDNALLTAFAETRRTVSEQDIFDVAVDLCLSPVDPMSSASLPNGDEIKSLLLRESQLARVQAAPWASLALPTIDDIGDNPELPLSVRWASRLGIRVRSKRSNEQTV